MSGLDLSILDATRRVAREDTDFLDKHLRRAATLLAVGGELRIRLVSDAEMAHAHERYAGVPGSTDVLTFDLSPPNSAGGKQIPIPSGLCLTSDRIMHTIDADVFVCVDEAARAAGLRGYPWRQEALLYAIHGLLHCLGHDDHDEAEYRAMHALEDLVLEALGVEARFDQDLRG
jgi:probable rRNA maturation factor